MKPTIGKIVHYTNLKDKNGRYPPEHQAAIVTGTYEPLVVDSGIDYVDLIIFYRTGILTIKLRIPFSETYERGHWSWPPQAK